MVALTMQLIMKTQEWVPGWDVKASRTSTFQLVGRRLYSEDRMLFIVVKQRFGFVGAVTYGHNAIFVQISERAETS